MPNIKSWYHVMVDLETYALDEKSVILSAAFVICDSRWNEIGTSYAVFNTEEQRNLYKRTVNPDTVAWWGKQDPAILAKATENPVSCVKGIENLFAPVLKLQNEGKKFMWWGNSAIFDLLKINSLIGDAMNDEYAKVFQIDEYRMRCYKSVRDIWQYYFGIKTDYAKVTHFAVDDARAQCDVMRRIWLMAQAAEIEPVPYKNLNELPKHKDIKSRVL